MFPVAIPLEYLNQYDLYNLVLVITNIGRNIWDLLEQKRRNVANVKKNVRQILPHRDHSTINSVHNGGLLF
jgi:hypothetical protein